MNVLGSSETTEKYLKIVFQVSLFAFSGFFHCNVESSEWIIFILQPQISKYPPIRVQLWEKAFASQNPRSTSQLVSKMPSLLVRSLHPFLCYTYLQPNSGSQSWIPSTQKQAQARQLSTQHLKFSNKQDGFKEDKANPQSVACFLHHLDFTPLTGHNPAFLRTTRGEAVGASPVINHRGVKTTGHKICASFAYNVSEDTRRLAE